MSNESEMVSGDLYEELLTLRRLAAFIALDSPSAARVELSRWLANYCPKDAAGKPDPGAVFKLIEASR